jgi:hypothetical protein
MPLTPGRSKPERSIKPSLISVVIKCFRLKRK